MGEKESPATALLPGPETSCQGVGVALLSASVLGFAFCTCSSAASFPRRWRAHGTSALPQVPVWVTLVLRWKIPKGRTLWSCSWKTKETRCIAVCTSQCIPALTWSRSPLPGTPFRRVPSLCRLGKVSSGLAEHVCTEADCAYSWVPRPGHRSEPNTGPLSVGCGLLRPQDTDTDIPL